MANIGLASAFPVARKSFAAPRLIGSSANKPIKHGGADLPEDMRYNDKSGIDGLGISDRLFKADDWVLFGLMKLLFTQLSMGDNSAISTDMVNRFRSNTGGEYRNHQLNQEIASNPSFTTFARETCNEFIRQLKKSGGNVNGVNIDLGKVFAFDKWSDLVNGMSIMINRVWAAEIFLSSFRLHPNGSYEGVFKYVLYDHFGLDKSDIIRRNKDKKKGIGTDEGFQAWWLLQHYRGYKPFVTVAEIFLPFRDDLGFCSIYHNEQ